MTTRFTTAVADMPRWQGIQIFALFLLAAAILHFPHYGMFVGDITRDFYLHYNWAKEFAENFALGNLYPRWIFHGRLGMGEPVFVFYAPLYYYAVAFIELLGPSTWAATQIVAVLATAVFGWFVYRTCAYYAAPRLSLIIGIVALTSPFLVMLHYKFDGPAWGSMGYASHGFLFWALFRPGASTKFVNVWAAIAIGIAAGSHVISALVNLVCYSAVALFPAPGKESWSVRLARSLASWGVSVALGLSLSAVYLVPALTYLDVIRAEVWDPSVPFTSFAWPLVTQFIYEQRWFSFQWAIPLPALALLVAPLAYVIYHRVAAEHLLKAVGVGAFAAFFASELSFLFWALDTPLTKIQLPFRFVSVVYTFGIVATGLALVHAVAYRHTAWRITLSALLSLSCLVGAVTLVKASLLDGKELPTALANDQYTFLPFVNRFQAEGECPEGDLDCLVAWGPSGSFRGTPEYRLAWAGSDYAAYAKSGLPTECAAKSMSCGPRQRTSTGLKWVITTNSSQSLVLPLFHFPSWETKIDGKTVEHTIDAKTGLIAVVIPAGTHELEIVWSLSRIERYGLYLSITALVILGTLSMPRRLVRKA